MEINNQTEFKKSLEALNLYIKTLNICPTEKIWNKYAVQNNYLSSESIKYFANKSFNKLCKEIIKN